MTNILTSWKEISQYLGKGVRTVQRWEREAGLPVRRPVGQPGRTVLAMREELDGWARSRGRGPSGAVAEDLRREMATLRADNLELRGRLSAIERSVLGENPATRLAVEAVEVHRNSRVIRSLAQEYRGQAVRARLSLASTLCAVCEGYEGERRLHALHRAQLSALEVARSLGRPGHVSARELQELRVLLARLVSRLEVVARSRVDSGEGAAARLLG